MRVLPLERRQGPGHQDLPGGGEGAQREALRLDPQRGVDGGARTPPGADALRLDCVTSNDRLRSYYETRGFTHRGDVTVGGVPGQRRDDGAVTWVSRFELTPLAAARAQ